MKKILVSSVVTLLAFIQNTSAATISFTADNTIVPIGSFTYLRLTTTGMNTCSIWGGIYGSSGQSIPMTAPQTSWYGWTGVLNETTTYTIFCSGLDNTLFSRVVKVIPRRIASTNGDQLVIYQGGFEDLGTVDQAADKLSQYDVVVLSHNYSYGAGTNTLPNPTSCVDTKYPQIAELIAGIRLRNTSVKIFGYVNSGIDAPSWVSENNNCGVKAGLTSWDCQGDGTCQNFKKLADKWVSLQDEYPGAIVDGIFIDNASGVYINTAVRNKVYGYVKSLNKNLMLNLSVTGNNYTFAKQSGLLGPGDYVASEGFYMSLGRRFNEWFSPVLSTEVLKEPIVGWYNEFYKNGNTGVRFAALPNDNNAFAYGFWTPSNPYQVNCQNTIIKEAYALYTAYFVQGNVFGYQEGGLGLYGHGVNYCDHTNFH